VPAGNSPLQNSAFARLWRPELEAGIAGARDEPIGLAPVFAGLHTRQGPLAAVGQPRAERIAAAIEPPARALSSLNAPASRGFHRLHIPACLCVARALARVRATRKRRGHPVARAPQQITTQVRES
jgi:hypothetical protein